MLCVKYIYIFFPPVFTFIILMITLKHRFILYTKTKHFMSLLPLTQNLYNIFPHFLQCIQTLVSLNKLLNLNPSYFFSYRMLLISTILFTNYYRFVLNMNSTGFIFNCASLINLPSVFRYSDTNFTQMWDFLQ